MTYLSPMFAVSLSLRASNIFSLFLSFMGDHACTSEQVTAKWGVTLNFCPVSRNLGNSNRPKRNVLTTFVVMVASLSSKTDHSTLATPAFSTKASSLSSPSAFFAKSLTDS